MKINFEDTATGRTAHIQIHRLVLKHCPVAVQEYAVRLMMKTGVDSVTVTPA